MTNKTIAQLNSGSAILNQAIYDAIDHHEDPKDVGDYVCMGSMDDINGLNSAIYRDKNTNKYTIVIAGTTEVHDYANDINMVLTKIPPQFHSLKAYMDTLETTYGISTDQIECITGHSLGASLATMIGALDTYKNIPVVAFNPYGVGNILPKIDAMSTANLSHQYSNITSFISDYDIVPRFINSQHIGNIFPVRNSWFFDFMGAHQNILPHFANQPVFPIPLNHPHNTPIKIFKKAEGEGCEPHDPIIFDLNNDGVLETTDINNGVYFDHENDGFAEASAWVGENDGILVVDSNNNGKIDNGTEVLLHSTLAAFDTNNDGIIDVNDADFNNLKILKGDGTLMSLAEAGIISINLNTTATDITDENGNNQFASGTFTKSDGTTGTFGEFLVNTDTTNSMATEWLEETAA